MHQLKPLAARSPSQGWDFARHRFQPHVLVSALSAALGPFQELEKSLGEALHPCPSPSCMMGMGTGVGRSRVAAKLAGWSLVPWGGRGTASPSLQSCQHPQHLKSLALQCWGESHGPGFLPRNEICVCLNGPTSLFAPVSPVASTATAPFLRPGNTMSPQHHR